MLLACAANTYTLHLSPLHRMEKLRVRLTSGFVAHYAKIPHGSPCPWLGDQLSLGFELRAISTLLKDDVVQLGLPTIESQHGQCVLLFAAKTSVFKDARFRKRIAKAGMALVGKPLDPSLQQILAALHLRILVHSRFWTCGDHANWTWLLKETIATQGPPLPACIMSVDDLGDDEDDGDDDVFFIHTRGCRVATQPLQLEALLPTASQRESFLAQDQAHPIEEICCFMLPYGTPCKLDRILPPHAVKTSFLSTYTTVWNKMLPDPGFVGLVVFPGAASAQAVPGSLLFTSRPAPIIEGRQDRFGGSYLQEMKEELKAVIKGIATVETVNKPAHVQGLWPEEECSLRRYLRDSFAAKLVDDDKNTETMPLSSSSSPTALGQDTSNEGAIGKTPRPPPIVPSFKARRPKVIAVTTAAKAKKASSKSTKKRQSTSSSSSSTSSTPSTPSSNAKTKTKPKPKDCKRRPSTAAGSADNASETPATKEASAHSGGDSAGVHTQATKDGTAELVDSEVPAKKPQPKRKQTKTASATKRGQASKQHSSSGGGNGEKRRDEKRQGGGDADGEDAVTGETAATQQDTAGGDKGDTSAASPDAQRSKKTTTARPSTKKATTKKTTTKKNKNKKKDDKDKAKLLGDDDDKTRGDTSKEATVSSPRAGKVLSSSPPSPAVAKQLLPSLDAVASQQGGEGVGEGGNATKKAKKDDGAAAKKSTSTRKRKDVATMRKEAEAKVASLNMSTVVEKSGFAALNTEVLRLWLSKHNVKTTTKMKKGVLIEKCKEVVAASS
ncbi:hypothetical protein PTSG_03721 [Salpingoeca rosetta]|uniref:Uncharacterized protein n=1 Tax=Salpingoeca rosetta (strain ATCC 50818 / BSB-021) TaxID=946362 RepID=F2U6E2_SALR5|nr:uncharacterized protein PTSG_03721 [Salpingoeca rosetta]EGD83083.1 hypothetical protein PTSG_03721 [Salpingoeca rosetta]|eukprot:XP_004995447.1 hypothetical protein PTSG_03721 [Salpingoeca rosetta]